MSGSRPYDPADLIEVEDEITLPTVPPLAALGVDPVTGYILAPLAIGADGRRTVALGALPHGVTRGELALADAPQGARNVATKIDGNWVWRLIDGEGWALREGKGAERSNGTRPKLQILEPCDSVTLRAVGVDEAFPLVTHHVVIAWVRLQCTERWTAVTGWLGSTEPSPWPGTAVRRWWTTGPRRIGVQACKAVLAVPPDARVVEPALAAAGAPDSDQDVST